MICCWCRCVVGDCCCCSPHAFFPIPSPTFPLFDSPFFGLPRVRQFGLPRDARLHFTTTVPYPRSLHTVAVTTAVFFLRSPFLLRTPRACARTRAAFVHFCCAHTHGSVTAVRSVLSRTFGFSAGYHLARTRTNTSPLRTTRCCCRALSRCTPLLLLLHCTFFATHSVLVVGSLLTSSCGSFTTLLSPPRHSWLPGSAHNAHCARAFTRLYTTRITRAYSTVPLSSLPAHAPHVPFSPVRSVLTLPRALYRAGLHTAHSIIFAFAARSHAHAHTPLHIKFNEKRCAYLWFCRARTATRHYLRTHTLFLLPASRTRYALHLLRSVLRSHIFAHTRLGLLLRGLRFAPPPALRCCSARTRCFCFCFFFILVRSPLPHTTAFCVYVQHSRLTHTRIPRTHTHTHATAVQSLVTAPHAHTVPDHVVTTTIPHYRVGSIPTTTTYFAHTTHYVHTHLPLPATLRSILRHVLPHHYRSLLLACRITPASSTIHPVLPRTHCVTTHTICTLFTAYVHHTVHHCLFLLLLLFYLWFYFACTFLLFTFAFWLVDLFDLFIIHC